MGGIQARSWRRVALILLLSLVLLSGLRRSELLLILAPQQTVPRPPARANSTTPLWVLANNQSISERQPFCLPWAISSDEWWTHNVQWEIGLENDTHYCFRFMSNSSQRNFFQSMYQLQFQSDCSEVLTTRMWSSGLGADMSNLLYLLQEGRVSGMPVQLEDFPWHYATSKPFNDSMAVCPSKDMFCYFLPLSNCPPSPNFKSPKDSVRPVVPTNEAMFRDMRYRVQNPSQWYWKYLTRPQTWFRKKVYDLVATQGRMPTPCLVMHVRRSDVTLHKLYSRKYRAVADYIRAVEQQQKPLYPNIFLLTDDHNAIGEAQFLYPKLHWIYWNRTRYRGAEGGFEHHFPSNDPALELAYLMATLRVVPQCSGIVRTQGNFGDLLETAMVAADRSVWKVNLDGGLSMARVFNGANANTVNVSKAYDALLASNASTG